MENSNLVLVIHSLCPASVNIHNKLLFNNININVIDLQIQEVEAKINIDVVPIIIIDNSNVLKGKAVFDYVEKLIADKNKPQNTKKKSGLYNNLYVAPPDNGKKTPVKLD
jgi:hypothetical protein